MIEIAGLLLAAVLTLLGLSRLLYPPLWRDVYTLFVNISILRKVRRSCVAREFIIDQFERQVARRPGKPLILFQDESYTYQQVNDQANRVAHTLLSLGVASGDIVAILMPNQPAFLWIYLGTQKLGAVAALVNHHLISESLRYSVTSCAPKLVVVGVCGSDDGLSARLSTLASTVDIPIYSYSRHLPGLDLPTFTHLMSKVSSQPFPVCHRGRVKLTDPCSFIFTSGTTGLPKAAIISHKKALLSSHSYGPVGFSSKEVMYVTLPLYHASALNLAFLNVINQGATIVLKEKFSVSQFWPDCVRHKVTCFQYIGEMLRYLVNTGQTPDETRHCVWAAVGNGLRPDIWTRFQSRFKIGHIFEFYGSTEIPATVINLFGVPGSVGRLSPLLSKLSGMILVQVDPNTGQPHRDRDGRCQPIAVGESGVLLAKLSDKVTFDGYLGSPTDTKNRILSDVIEPGDFYVNTGDIFTLDPDYNMFFKDRTGDTFRWKGENVSTAEVSNIMNSAPFVQDTNVFGVQVPGCEGKAGMAAVNLKEGEELDSDKLQEISQLCRQRLPGYARPRFLRIQRQMSLTSTFKQQKTELVRDGFDPRTVDEPLYYLDRSTDDFKPLDDMVYKEIINGHIAL